MRIIKTDAWKKSKQLQMHKTAQDEKKNNIYLNVGRCNREFKSFPTN